MKKIIWIFGAFTLLFAQNSVAQDQATAGATETVSIDRTPTQYAEMRAASYASTFGLGEQETAKMVKIFLQGEQQMTEALGAGGTPEEIQARADRAMAPYDEHAEQMLNEEQKAKLDQMKKDGTWHPGAASCAPAAKGKSCAGHGTDAKAGGCCAGKAGAHGAGTAKPATPTHNATMQ